MLSWEQLFCTESVCDYASVCLCVLCVHVPALPMRHKLVILMLQLPSCLLLNQLQFRASHLCRWTLASTICPALDLKRTPQGKLLVITPKSRLLVLPSGAHGGLLPLSPPPGPQRGFPQPGPGGGIPLFPYSETGPRVGDPWATRESSGHIRC